MNRLVGLVIFASLLVGVLGSPAARVVGGAEAIPGEVPSIVALLRHVPGTQIYSFHCAGVLIYPHIVLSAAQCFDDMYLQPTSWRVRVGSVLHDSDGVIINVVGIRRHEYFDRSSLENDAALVNLGGPVNVINVAPAQLPTTSTVPDSGAYAIIAGWGATSATAPATNTSSILQVANVQIADAATCGDNLRMVGFELLTSHFCTIGSGAGICHNDIGSPIYHGGFLVGIASFHVGCGFDVFPAVYTAVSPLQPWIASNVLG